MNFVYFNLKELLFDKKIIKICNNVKNHLTKINTDKKKDKDSQLIIILNFYVTVSIIQNKTFL